MSQRNVEDYLQEGIHGTHLPKQEERNRFLGNLRERIVFVLTISEVMTQKGREELETLFKKHREASLYLNGEISYNYIKDIRQLANQYDIQYTSITNEEIETDIGVVLAYDYAVHEKHIFLKDFKQEKEKGPQKKNDEKLTFFQRIKQIFK